MTIFTNSDAKPETDAKKLTTTSAFTLGPVATDNFTVRLESLIACCDGTATAFSLWIDDGSGNSIYIVNGKQVAANDYLQITNHPVTLKSGAQFKCQAAAADHITVTAALALASKSKGDNPSR